MRAFRAGAKGYIMKNCEPAQLLDAIRCVAAGKKYMTPDFADFVLTKMIDPAEELPHFQLSERETQIFDLLVAGWGLIEIADRICISRKTVSTYRMRILEKLQLQSNADLVKYAILHKLVRD
jgi:DNA-binding NarL/FixJ family response regulator